MALSKKTRFEVFKRDGFRCLYCGRTPPAVFLEVDHIKPVVDGGEDDIDNLVTSCFDCNRGKGAIPLSSIPQSLKEKAEIIAEQEEQIQGYGRIIRAKKERIESETWAVLKLLRLTKRSGDDLVADARKFASVKRFVEQLGWPEVEEAAEIANLAKPYPGNQNFLYFCGICWRKIKAGAP